MNLDVRSNRARLELLPGYPNLFDVMFDSVKIEGSPVEAEEDSDETESGSSDDEEGESEMSYEEYLSSILPTVHGVPCNRCVRLVADDLDAATVHRLKLEEMVALRNRYELTDVEVAHIRSCLLGFYYRLIRIGLGDLRPGEPL